jgi:hypothetical protein
MVVLKLVPKAESQQKLNQGRKLVVKNGPWILALKCCGFAAVLD